MEPIPLSRRRAERTHILGWGPRSQPFKVRYATDGFNQDDARALVDTIDAWLSRSSSPKSTWLKDYAIQRPKGPPYDRKRLKPRALSQPAFHLIP